MFAVVFEVLPSASGYQRYLDIAAALRPKLEAIDGFVSVERFKCLTDAGWVLSLSLWRDQAALIRWRSHGEHHAAQAEGRQAVFADYRIRVLRMIAEAASPETAAAGALVGLVEYPDLANGNARRRYQSLSNADKHIDLYDLPDLDAALAWRGGIAQNTAEPTRAQCGAVLRDYGLFERTQAPQHFPEIDRGKRHGHG